jgi:hypothetical protein
MLIDDLYPLPRGVLVVLLKVAVQAAQPVYSEGLRINAAAKPSVTPSELEGLRAVQCSCDACCSHRGWIFFEANIEFGIR